MGWTSHRNLNMLGLLPYILQPEDERRVEDQIEDRYAHGGGLSEMNGFTFVPQTDTGLAILQYPGDPDFNEVGRCYFPHTKQMVILFDCAFVVITEEGTETFTVTRMD